MGLRKGRFSPGSTKGSRKRGFFPQEVRRVPVREGFDPNFLGFRKRGFSSGSTEGPRKGGFLTRIFGLPQEGFLTMLGVWVLFLW